MSASRRTSRRAAWHQRVANATSWSFHVLANAEGPRAQVPIDSSAVKAHRLASGGKGRTEPGHRSLLWLARDQDPPADRLRLSTSHSRSPASRLPTARPAEALLEQMPPALILSGDKGFQRIATRYDRPAVNSSRSSASPRPSAIGFWFSPQQGSEHPMPSSVTDSFQLRCASTAPLLTLYSSQL